jgi:hypothetical protein
MQENNYYTPSIEEFCADFEYEVRSTMLIDKGWHTTKEPVWSRYKFEFGNYLSAYYLTEKIKDKLWTNDARVKYLDKSDIESLGFSTEFKDTDYTIIYTKNGYNLVYYTSEKLVLIDNENKRLFNGIIKNISELRKLLKQLGIE